MLLKKIKLENIRSYKNQEIVFPEGSLMLSGDIGSGKSTILLAAEFALFGITREVSGGLLLRNGETAGAVELFCEIEGKEITIKRKLKQSGSSVTQDAGYLLIDGHKHDLTAVELKQKILELLNYPQELLKKTKSMIYRYTVYAPQETMKEILLGKKEDRLEILRRVFGIDKYKRIRNSTEVFMTNIKQKTRELAVVTADYFEKETELKSKQKTEEELQKAITEVVPKIAMLQTTKQGKKEEINVIEKKIQEQQEILQKIEALTVTIEHKVKESTQNKESWGRIQEEIKKLDEDIAKAPKVTEGINEKIKEITNGITQQETDVLGQQKQMAIFESKITNHEQICNDISTLAQCPVCKQSVEESYKQSVITKSKKDIEEINQKRTHLQSSITEGNNKITEKKQLLQQLQDEKSKQEVVQLKQENKKEKQHQAQESIKNIERLKGEIAATNTKKQVLEEQRKAGPEWIKDKETKVKELENIEQNLKDLEIAKARKEAEQTTIVGVIESLQREVITKKNARDNIGKLKSLLHWLENQFINVMSVIEKKIMLRVHNELETLLQKWFTILVDSEVIKIRLDEEFTPIIEQNGHEIEYTYLSGGEKTAAALSYRLALNQVINSLMTTIKTKDLLILDEPTDGFSDEQLERMRNILEELNTKQTILVSHDHKIESFVDAVIRLNKTEHITSVIE